MTGPPAPDDPLPGNGHKGLTAAVGRAGGDPVDARPARLAAFWALVLQRFRDYAHKNSDLAVRPERPHEQDR